MPKRNIDIVIKARDQASKKFGRVGKSASGLSRTLRRLALAGGAYLSARAVKNFVGSSLTAYGRQEQAAKKLGDALALIGPEAAGQVPGMEKFARSIQRVTTIGDEAILELMSLGAGLGKLSGKGLKDATLAAMGLSRLLGIDTVAAMRLVARAAVGDTSMLARYGIKLDETLTPQEKFNELMRRGAEAFSLAEGEAETYAGRLQQMKNAWGDLTESIGKSIATSDLMSGAISSMTWGFQNAGDLWELVKNKIALGFVSTWEDAKHLFTEQIPHALEYMFDNFGSVFDRLWTNITTFFENLWTNIKNAHERIVNATAFSLAKVMIDLDPRLSDEEKTASKQALRNMKAADQSKFVWDPLTEGMVDVFDEFDPLPPRVKTELENKLTEGADKAWQAILQRELGGDFGTGGDSGGGKPKLDIAKAVAEQVKEAVTTAAKFDPNRRPEAIESQLLTMVGRYAGDAKADADEKTSSNTEQIVKETKKQSATLDRIATAVEKLGDGDPLTPANLGGVG